MTCTLARAWLGALEVGVQEGLESLRVDELGLSVGGLETCVEVIGKPPVHAHITVELAEVVVQHTSPCHRAPLRADYPQDYGPANKALVLPSRLMSTAARKGDFCFSSFFFHIKWILIEGATAFNNNSSKNSQGWKGE